MIVKHPQDLCHPHPQAQNRRRLPEWLPTSCHGFVLGLQELVTVRGHRWAPMGTGSHAVELVGGLLGRCNPAMG